MGQGGGLASGKGGAKLCSLRKQVLLGQSLGVEYARGGDAGGASIWPRCEVRS